MKKWQTKALQATLNTRFGCIIRCAFDVDLTTIPRFVGKPSITSDGFVMCDFISRDGIYRHGAFVGDVEDVRMNVRGLTNYLKLNPKDALEFKRLLSDWTNESV